MDTLQDEIKELKSFIAELKADRIAQKEKERRENWTKYTSMSLVFVAVLAAIATQWAGKYSSRVLVQLNDSTFHQAKASDKWSFYQAKSIKQNLYEVARDQIALTARATADAKSLDTIKDKIARYDQEKKQVQNEATELERLRDEARRNSTNASQHGGRMGLAVSIFQIAIAMGSICLVTKKKPLWYLSMLLSLVAVAEMIYAWVH
jgi:hypothetical protein